MASDKKTSSGGSFGSSGGRSKAPPPAPARKVDTAKQEDMEARRAQLRAKQAAWQADNGKLRAPSAGNAATAAPAASAADTALAERLSRCQSTFDDLQDDIMLAGVYSDMGSATSVLSSLATDLEEVRAQGYVFSNYLENKVATLSDKWESATRGIDVEIERQGEALAQEATTVRRLVQQASRSTPALSQAESAVQSLERKATFARDTITGRYSDVEGNIHTTRAQLDHIQWLMAEAASSEVEWQAGEYPVSAAKARLLEAPEKDEGPEGTLFLTDERLIFEQKEKKATKKFLFITTESEMVCETLLAEPLGHIVDSQAQDKRHFLSTKELLTLHFSSAARQPTATFRLLEDADNESWIALIKRVSSGEIERERLAAFASEKEEMGKQIAAAPTVCGTCGANFPATLTRGQQSITCEYCGAITRL